MGEDIAKNLLRVLVQYILDRVIILLLRHPWANDHVPA